jgi:hypothetical protein
LPSVLAGFESQIGREEIGTNLGNDYLMLGYMTDPSDNSFWSTSDENYDRPDPAFILPS